MKKALKKTEKKKINVNDRLVTNKDLVIREEGKEALVFDPNTGSIKVLNYVGKMVWKFIDGKCTILDIEKKLQKRFKEMKPSIIKKDLDNFLTILEGLGYVGKKI